MSDLCSACLTSGARMKTLSNFYEKMYLELAQISRQKTSQPITLCYICFAQLLRCQQFSLMAHQSETFLSDVHSKNIQLSPEMISDLILKKSINLTKCETPAPINVTSCDSIKIELLEETFTYEDEIEIDLELKGDEIINYKREKSGELTNNILLKAYDFNKNEDLQSIVNDDFNSIKNSEECYINYKQKSDKKICNGEKPFSELLKHLKSHEKKNLANWRNDKNPHKSSSNFSHTCMDCNKVFKNKCHLTEHRRFHTGEKPFACGICHKRFYQKGHLKDHSEVHTREKAYSCDLCNKKFGFKSNLNVHLRRHDRGWTGFDCPCCGKNFDHKNSLTRHLKIHGNHPAIEGEDPITKQKLYTCQLCDKLLNSQNKLDLHIETHSNDTIHACEFCDSKFVKKSLLQRHHTRKHTHFKCADCGNIYSGDFKSHLLTHDQKSLETDQTDDKNNIDEVFCDYCLKKFKCKKNLATHMIKIHPNQNNDIPLTCDKCEKTFRTHKQKQRHIFSYHTEKTETVFNTRTPKPDLEKPFVCDRCPKRFLHLGGLKQHMIMHSGLKQFACTKCDRVFVQRSSLYDHNRRAHLKDKSYVCSQCGKRCAAACDLRTHVRIVHEGDKPFVCEICHKRCSMRSNLVRHMRTHTGERPSVCKLCNRRFADGTSLKKHRCKQINDIVS